MTNIKSKKGFALPLPRVLMAATVLSVAQLSQAAPFLLNDYNLITLYDGTPGSGDLVEVGEIEGRAFIGGDFLADTQVNVGFKYSGPTTTDVQLQVAGTVGGPANPGVNITVTGSTEIDEAFTATTTTQWTVDGSGRVINATGATGSDLSNPGNLDALAAGYTAELHGNSADFAALTDTATWSYTNTGDTVNSSINFDVGSLTTGDQAIFTIDASKINGLAQQGFQLAGSFSDVDEIIINVTNTTGIDLTFNQNFNNGFNQDATRQKILWNFTGSDWGSGNTITHSTNFRGSVLAPYADWDAQSQNVDGSIAVRSFESTGEIHVANLSVVNDGTTGGNTTVQAPESDDEVEVPEPGTLSLMVLGMLMCVLSGRRRIVRSWLPAR